MVDQEVEGLQRVLTRLALTEDTQLEGVLQKLLPVCLRKLETKSKPVQQQVLSILSHVNKRLQVLPNAILPLDDLVCLYSEATNPLVRNFTLVYVERGMERASGAVRLSQVSALVAGVAGRPGPQRIILLRLACMALEQLSSDTTLVSRPTESEAFREKYPVLRSEADRRVFLDYGMRLMLYIVTTSKGPRSALAAAHQQHAQQESTLLVPPPPGLSAADVLAIEGKSPPVGSAALQRRKLGFLQFTVQANMDPTEVLPVYLAAASDPADIVSQRGSDLLKKRCAIDSVRPDVDLESEAVLEPLFRLFHGSLDDESLPVEERRTQAGIPLRSRLLNLFCKSVAAANYMPYAMMTATDCLSSSSPPRLQQQSMEFAVWMLKHASPEALAPAAPVVIEHCLKLLDDSSARAAGASYEASVLSLRAFAYQAIGQLAQRLPQSLEGRMDLAARFFEALASEPPGVRAAVAEATSALVAAFQDNDAAEQMALFDLVSTSAMQPQEAVRGAAIEWAKRLFSFDYVQARYVCIMGAADVNHQLASAANEGLAIEKFKATSTPRYPRLSKMIEYLGARHHGLKSHVLEGSRLAMPAAAFRSAIQFLERCRQHEEPADAIDNLNTYFLFLENALVREAPADLHATALRAFLSIAPRNREQFTSFYATRSAVFLRLIAHVNLDARDAAARLVGMLCAGMSSEQSQQITESVISTLVRHRETKKVRFEEIHGSIAALGYIAAQLVTGVPAVEPAIIQTAFAELQNQLENLDVSSELRASAAVALGCAFIPAHPSTLNAPDPLALVKSMAGLLSDKDPKVLKSVVQALGFMMYACRNDVVSQTAIDGLLGLRTCKNEAVLFTVGEALCMAFGGVSVTADDLLRTPFKSLADVPTTTPSMVKAGSEETHAIEPMTICEEEKDESMNRVDAQSRILNALFDECLGHSRPEVRCAGATWLVSLLLFCGSTSAVKTVLPRAQESLAALLGDESELTQEMASRGLAAAYELADDATRAALVDSLVATLSGSVQGRKRRAGEVTPETRVFEPGSLGSAPGGVGLSTYKEICTLATELGQPELVYRFMQLANAQAVANASRGAAFGFASIAKLAGDALTPHIAALVPRLYRAQYDPQPKVRDAMKHIWMALIDDPRATLTTHFDAVMTLLLADMTGPTWRGREAAALATTDLLQGRQWKELRPHFAALWTALFRVLDDVKETVRQAGLSLARCMQGLTLRLTDPELTPAKEGQEAVEVVLPIIVREAIPSRVPEVQAIALDTTAKVAKAAGPTVLRPVLPLLVPAMLESLSGLEDSRLNYVEQHAHRLGLDAERLESARVSAAQGGIVGETLDLCARQMDGTTLEALTSALAGLIRRGVGLNTRAGAGRFVTQVARRLGSDVGPSSPALMRALREAAAVERSPAVRRSYAVAHAVLAKHAPPARVAKIVENLVAAASGDDPDGSSRSLSGLLLRSLAKEAPEEFALYAQIIAPVAFLMQFDPMPSVAEMWAEVWEESTTSTGAGLRLYIRSVLEAIIAGIRSSQWGRKRAAADAIVKIANAGADVIATHAAEVTTLLLDELPGRLWEGKEAVLTALGSLVDACPRTVKEGGTDGPSKTMKLPEQVVTALLDAASKKKGAYRQEALLQLKIVLGAWRDTDFSSMVAGPLLSICSDFARGAQTKTTSNSDTKPPEVPIAETLGALGAVWGCEALTWHERDSWVADGARALAAILDACTKSSDQEAAIDAALRFFRRCQTIQSTVFLADRGSALPAMLEPYSGMAVIESLICSVQRIATDGKSALLRERALLLLELLMALTAERLSKEQKESWRQFASQVMKTEKVPAVSSAAAALIAKLET